MGTSLSVPMVRFGRARFSQFTYYGRGLRQGDPVNLVFAGNAQPSTVDPLLETHIFPPWLRTGLCSLSQWVYIDTSRTGGLADWVSMSATRATGGCAFTRCHMRLFDGGNDPSSNGLGRFTIGSTHYETANLLRPIHKVRDYDKTRDFLQALARGKSFLAKAPRKVRIQSNPGVAGSVSYDGRGTLFSIL